MSERAAKVELLQLYQIRQGLQAMFNQKFYHGTYSRGGLTLAVDPEAQALLTNLGDFSDRAENDGFRGNTSIIKCNPSIEKFVQLSRSVMAGDLPYFFAIKTAASALSEGAFAQVCAIGVTKYGVVPDKLLTERTQLPHAWIFAARPEIASEQSRRQSWKFYHDKGYLDVNFREQDLRPRTLGMSDVQEAKEDKAPNSRYDVLGCLVDRWRGVIEIFKYLPHAESHDNAAGSYFESTTLCQVEAPDHLYPTVAILDGTEKGHVEIACSRFVRSREEAVLLFREIFA